MRGRRTFFLRTLVMAMTLAIASLWVRSYRYADLVVVTLPGGYAQFVMSYQGRVAVALTSIDIGRERGGWLTHGSDHAAAGRVAADEIIAASDAQFEGLGFAVAKGSPQSLIFGHSLAGSWLIVQWPFAFVAGVFVMILVVRLVVLRRRRRQRLLGLCRVCGYDLRASPDRCPECGTAVV